MAKKVAVAPEEATVPQVMAAASKIVNLLCELPDTAGKRAAITVAEVALGID